MPEGDTPAEWVEANIEPPSYDQREKLLLDVVDPLIHEVLRDRVGDWHYFWEPALRLRIRWQQPTQADYTRLTDFLNAAEADGKLAGGRKEATAGQVRSTRARLRSSGPISGHTRTRTGRPRVSWPWLL